MDRLRSFFSGTGAAALGRASDVDALLVTHLPNVAYLCGFTGSSGVLLVEAGSATLFTDSRYTFQAREQVFDAKTEIVAGPLLTALAVALKRRKGSVRLGFSPAQVTVSQKLVLDAALGTRIRWVNAIPSIAGMR